MKKVLIGTAIFLIVAFFIVVSIITNNSESTSTGGRARHTVEVGEVKKGEISSSISVNGYVESADVIEVYFDSTARADKVLLSRGQQVSEGEKLINLDLSSLESELDGLKTNKNIQKLEIEKTRTMTSNRDTDYLESLVNTSKDNLGNAKSTYEESIENLDKSKKLYEAGAISKSELNSAEDMVKTSEMQVRDAENNLKHSKQNLNDAILSAKSSDIDIEVQVKNLKKTEDRIKEIEKNIERLKESALSPIDGVISEINVVEGETINNVQPAFKIINNDSLIIKANIRELDIKYVEIGQKVNISADAVDRGSEISGKIEYISPVAERITTSNNTETVVGIEIFIDKGVELLRPGYSVTCEIATDMNEEALIASFEMFGREDSAGNRYMYVVDDENIVREKKITLGITSDFEVEITDGLSEGDRVIINPSNNIEDGMLVNIN
ncbi:efflux RND transporter periplasmic adaptor subunit [Herbivorax sp. ANBcel31]|uniref:efflux RND transporter periplasmic adaptor subunit n=1 Tax=Herbivorax sp. ANBcel31 TaxID=3069754 RepID=UPI0027B503A9|nr:efflux RND transporter periplasmic adaptor subunit [Herbivorax sp. ANBcel31]MDQ2087566.1 efflux RND transporter periplasmic adaptor subunit [Herbivorax sp. ANBcel31]